MRKMLGNIYLATFLFGFASCSVFPVGKCKTDNVSCMRQAFQAAIPAFMDGVPDAGIEVMDPMELDDIAFDLSGLKFTLNEGRMRGMKGTVIDNVKWDLKKKKIQIDFHTNTSIRGHYTAAGRLLILPISGDGQMRLKLRNVAVQMILDFQMVTVDDNSKKFLKPTKYNFNFEVKDNAHYNLTGLFNGNDGLSNTMLTFLNENWKQVSAEFGRPIMDAAAKKIFKGIVAFFNSEPLEDLVDL